MTQGVLVFAEVADGALAAIAKEMLGAGRGLAAALGEPLLAAVVGSGVQGVAQEAIAYGADTVYVADAPALERYQTLSYTDAMAQIVHQATPNILLIGMSDNGRDLGPRLAFRLRTGLASDCVGLAINTETKLLEATRPVSGGNAMATVVIEQARPQMATVRGKTMEPALQDASRQGKIEAVSVNLDVTALPAKIIERVKAEATGVRLEDAEIVISGGRGLKGPDDFYGILEPCAKALGGAMARRGLPWMRAGCQARCRSASPARLSVRSCILPAPFLGRHNTWPGAATPRLLWRSTATRMRPFTSGPTSVLLGITKR
jgi:electron transfer flavoprotein alpha subunit